MYLLIDNYDSFTYNLYQAFSGEKIKLIIKRNDEITVEEIAKLRPDKIVISPGPKTPKEAGISVQAVQSFRDKVPILGICLGHQCIAEAFGGKISGSDEIIHGKTSMISHTEKNLFSGISSPFPAARYHSLVVTDIPDSLEITARAPEGTIMGIQHKSLPVFGLQFHPESFLTLHGKQIIKNFIKV